MQVLNLAVAIDDIHPEIGWGMPDDECMGYLDSLNKEFDIKFTLFIPSNYHGHYPLSEHKDWINWLKSLGYFELAAHGHYHMTSNKDTWGEMEFAELQDPKQITNRISLMQNEWQAVEIDPIGWRNPGWICSPQSNKQLRQIFKYAAVHYVHNRGLTWGDCKTIFGADGIHETNIQLHGNNLMFQSHIAGDWNKNSWTKENYEQFRVSLEFLFNSYTINNKFLMEII
jgi:peptidoglycan/xylan/chitin deacetylase (PgdA/CDA1 family)